MLFFLAVPSLADISAQLSHASSSLDEPVRLRLEIKGEQNARPDLSVLEQDFQILGRSQHQSVTVINGQRSQTQGLILTLLPKRLGQLTVPPIRVGDEQSEPLRLEVTASARPSDSDSEQKAFIQLALNKTQAYVQEEVILTVSLYLPEGIWGEDLSDPQTSLQNTLVRLLQEEQYQALRDGKNYRVVERLYAIHAYQTGKLLLRGVKFRGRLTSAQGQSIYPGGPGRQAVWAESEQIQLEVLPIPPAFTGKHWLPARNLQIIESGLNSAGTMTAGKPASRHIVLIADGQMAAQLPDIDPQVPKGIKQYLEHPQNQDRLSPEGISGSRHAVITLVAAEPGSYELPAFEIPWWNTESDRQELAKLPAISLQVSPGLPGSRPAINPQPLGDVFQENATADTKATSARSYLDSQDIGNHNLLVWFLAGGWLLTLSAWWWNTRKKKTSPPTPPEQVEVEPQTEGELTEICSAMRTAYHDTDPDAARKVWLKWAEHRWPDNPPSNLSRLANRCPRDIAQAVEALDRAIYSPAKRSDWASHSPWKLLAGMQGIPEDTQSKPRPALYSIPRQGLS